MRWKDNTINHNRNQKNKLYIYSKVLDKIFIAQRSKGRMSLDWWNSWVLRSKSI